ncbi:hypothetical protein [Methylobacterium oxalidis]|uniref:hypothetical protein n=1 Tax=Methylobacterium oxalidis TaxID=944322 RepID=UPI003315D554
MLTLRQIEVQTAQGMSIGVSCKNGVDIFERRLMEKHLKQKIFHSLEEAQAVIDLRQNTYNS